MFSPCLASLFLYSLFMSDSLFSLLGSIYTFSPVSLGK